MKAHEYLKKVEECERVVEQLYTHLATRFETHSDLHKLLKGLAAEESEHAHRARFATPARLHDPKMLPQPRNVPDIDAALVEAQEALREALAGGWGTTAQAVLARAIELEERLGNVHSEAITAFARPELKSFFATLEKQDRHHASLLRESIARLAVAS